MADSTLLIIIINVERGTWIDLGKVTPMHEPAIHASTVIRQVCENVNDAAKLFHSSPSFDNSFHHLYIFVCRPCNHVV